MGPFQLCDPGVAIQAAAAQVDAQALERIRLALRVPADKRVEVWFGHRERQNIWGLLFDGESEVLWSVRIRDGLRPDPSALVNALGEQMGPEPKGWRETFFDGPGFHSNDLIRPGPYEMPPSDLTYSEQAEEMEAKVEVAMADAERHELTLHHLAWTFLEVVGGGHARRWVCHPANQAWAEEQRGLVDALARTRFFECQLRQLWREVHRIAEVPRADWRPGQPIAEDFYAA